MREFGNFCQKTVKNRAELIILAEVYMVVDWFLAFHQEGFLLMPYQYAFIYESDTVSKRHVTGFPKTWHNMLLMVKHPVYTQTVSSGILIRNL